MNNSLLPLYKRMVEEAYKHANPFLPSCCSALPIIFEIYDKMEKGDQFILSKGHAKLAHDVVKEYYGQKPDYSIIMEYEPIYTGSLGHGLPFAIGMAMANKIKKNYCTVYVLLGDGECQEGTTWESVCIIQRQIMSGIEIHVDVNYGQGSGFSKTGPAMNLLKIVGEDFVKIHRYDKGCNIKFLEDNFPPGSDKPPPHTFWITDELYPEIMRQF